MHEAIIIIGVAFFSILLPIISLYYTPPEKRGELLASIGGYNPDLQKSNEQSLQRDRDLWNHHSEMRERQRKFDFESRRNWDRHYEQMNRQRHNDWMNSSWMNRR